MDVVPTYRRLLPDQPAPERTLAQPRSSSALIFYWGIGRRVSRAGRAQHLLLGRLPARVRGHFPGANRRPPTRRCTSTSPAATRPPTRPPGHENWFVMVNVPHDQGQDWPALVAQTRAAVLRRLSQALGTDLGPLIRAEHVWDAAGHCGRTSSFGGALYGSSSNNTAGGLPAPPQFFGSAERAVLLWWLGAPWRRYSALPALGPNRI